MRIENSEDVFSNFEPTCRRGSNLKYTTTTGSYVNEMLVPYSFQGVVVGKKVRVNADIQTQRYRKWTTKVTISVTLL